MDRWKEYDAKTLTPPCVVQHDVIGKEHLIWVWDGMTIHGPMSQENEEDAIKAVINKPVVEVMESDNRDTEIKQLKEENTKLKDDIAKATAQISELQKPIKEDEVIK